MPEYIDRIIREMARIYTLFCYPIIYIDKVDSAMRFEYKWQNKDAELYYNNLSEYLGILQGKWRESEGSMLTLR